mmetsp:Transcript_11780/g.32638  ORF Transcript_11780/g.32638 Transcript_11780/m.32638 type:complete len:475 (-) Transcript_11780:39-1463(-)
MPCDGGLADMADFDPQQLLQDDDELAEFEKMAQAFDGEDITIPNILNRQDISFFYEAGLDDLSETLQFVFERSPRMPRDEEDDVAYLEETGVLPPPQHSELPPRLTARGGGFASTTARKIRHDLEQARYLATALHDETESEFFENLAAPIYQGVLENIQAAGHAEDDLYLFSAKDYEESKVDMVYNKAWRPTFLPALMDAELGKPKKVLRKGRPKKESLQALWKKGVVVLDNVLSGEAVQLMQQIMAKSTVWFEPGIPEINGGDYVAAASLDDGLQDNLLLQMVYELEETILQPMVSSNDDKKSDLVLHDLWARKYLAAAPTGSSNGDDADTENIKYLIPGDLQSDIRVHLWLTPDTDNNNGGSGLTIYKAEPPADYDPTSERAMEEVVETILKPSQFANTTVPQKFNRAVIFNARLFHARHQDDDDSTTEEGTTKEEGTYPDKYSTELTLLYGPKLKPDEGEMGEDAERDDEL